MGSPDGGILMSSSASEKVAGVILAGGLSRRIERRYTKQEILRLHGHTVRI